LYSTHNSTIATIIVLLNFHFIHLLLGSLHRSSIPFSQNLVRNGFDNSDLAVKVDCGNRSLIALELGESGLGVSRQCLGRGVAGDGIEALLYIVLDLIRVTVVETCRVHAIGKFCQGGDHTRILIDEIIQWVVVGHC
jgi:hypothetical protein